MPATPASTKAEAGPVASTRAPPAAAPIDEPIAVAVASQANASVTVPAGAASSTMAYALARIGAIIEPASAMPAAKVTRWAEAPASAR
jgi:hypothetical protein